MPEIILSSGSPRRKQLLKSLGYDFKVISKSVEEILPTTIKASDAALYLSELKLSPWLKENIENKIIITSDTTVIIDDDVLGKPKDKKEAIQFLNKLSNRSHFVISGVSILYNNQKWNFQESTEVFFKELTDNEIEYYIDNFKPYDKAGAYGIQEWIGMIGVTKIKGCYYNVMGMPLVKLNEVLREITN